MRLFGIVSLPNLPYKMRSIVIIERPKTKKVLRVEILSYLPVTNCYAHGNKKIPEPRSRKLCVHKNVLREFSDGVTRKVPFLFAILISWKFEK